MSKRRFGLVASLALSLGLAATPAAAADPVAPEPVAGGAGWPQWRGPHFNGSSDAKGLPNTFDAETNVLWSTALPGPGAGTPIVTGDRVFVSALDAASKKLLAICASRADGKILWQKEVGEGFRQNERNNLAAPSAVTDGSTVWFYFGTGDLAAFDLEGKPLWARNVAKDHGPFNFMWIYGSSPLLYDGRLYVQVLHRDQPYGDGGGSPSPAPSYLLAIDPKTGQDLWKQDRPDEAREETKESYATPIPFEHDGQKLVLLVGGDVVTAHDAATGKELWRFGGWNPEKVGHWRMVPSVVTGAGLVFACAPKNGPVMAIKPGGSGDVTASHLAWKSDQLTSDVCVPLFYKDKLFILNGDGDKTLTRVDPATGNPEASVKLGGGPVFRASPAAADGKIYCVNEQGEAWVVSADKLEVLSQAELSNEGGEARASIALTDGQVFVRTADTLYCFGTKK